MKQARNPKVFFGLSIGVFAGAIGFLFMQNQGLNSLRSKVGQLREQDREQNQIYVKLQQSQKDLQDLQTQLAHLEASVPDSAYVPTMLKELELAGKQKGIEVTGLRPATKKPSMGSKDKAADTQKPYMPLDLELKGRGKYADLQAFVESLNSFPKIVAVRTVTLAPNATNNATDHRLEVTIGLRAFVFQPKGASQKTPGGSV